MKLQSTSGFTSRAYKNLLANTKSLVSGWANIGGFGSPHLTDGLLNSTINQASRFVRVTREKTLEFSRDRFQQGSIRRVSRKAGADVWEYRYRDHAEPGSPMRQISLSTLEFPTEKKALIRLQEDVLRINGPEAFKTQNQPTLGLLIDRFSKEERLEEIMKQQPGETTITDGFSYSTASGYRSYLKRHITPKWGSTALVDIKALAVTDWLKSLPLSPKTRGQVRALLHLLFEKAILWELIELQRNPIELVKVKGSSSRLKKPQVISPEQFQQLVATLREPHKTMVTVAMLTGLRVSELLALRWEHIDLEAGVVLVQQGVVSGRIGKVKTEASHDEIPLDSAFVQILSDWKGDRSKGLVFPSPVTGGCYHAGMLQRQILRPKGVGVGIQGLGWHTFRHTYRSLLDETGAPIGVQQKLMRHSNVATTMNVYGSASIKAKQQANSKVVQMVMRQEKPQAEPESVAV